MSAINIELINILYSFQASNTEWQSPSAEIAKIQQIEVMCEKSHIRVSITFDKPFQGIIFSKGYYSDQSCIHLQPTSGTISTSFEIGQNNCGLTSSGNIDFNGQPNPAGSYVENTIIIQYDPQVQEVWDQARRLRCTWYDYYEKAVTFKPFQVNMLNAVTANFLGDSLQCWMQIQVGKGPWASEVSGIVKIGQTMTMVLGIKDEENKFDMLVRNCVAHDGKRTPIKLVDELGCIQRPKIMSNFQKIKNFGSSASVVAYAYFQAFKFPDSMNVHFQCVIQVCRFSCPDPQCPSPNQRRRLLRRRSAMEEEEETVEVLNMSNGTVTTTQYPVKDGEEEADGADLKEDEDEEEEGKETKNIPTTNILRVLSPNDVAFKMEKFDTFLSEEEFFEDLSAQNKLCITFPGTSGSVLVFFTSSFVTSIFVLIFFWPKRPGSKTTK